jgi:hypothetical protein
MGNFLGNIHNILFDVFQKKDGFSVGEKFTQIEKITKKRFFNLTDQEIYEALETYKAMPLEEDEKLSEEDFLGWVNLKTPEGNDIRIFAGNSNFNTK